MVSNWFITRAKSKRWRAFALALGLCLFSGAAMVTPLGSSAVTAMQQAADELEDYLNRSPGERGAVLAGKGKGGGKGKGVALAAAPSTEGPTEEALGKVFDIPADPVEEIAGTEAPAAPVGPPLAEAPNVLAPGGFVPSGGGFPIGGGFPGGGGGGGGGGGPPPVVTPPPVGAVPEPSTWALLIMGFMFTGGMMRRANRTKRSPAHA